MRLPVRALGLIALVVAVLALPGKAGGQAFGGNEYVAGAALNVALRVPYVSPAWRRPVTRFVLAQSISLGYERFVDVNYGREGHEFWEDVGGRLAGYLITEAVVTLVFKRPRSSRPDSAG